MKPSTILTAATAIVLLACTSESRGGDSAPTDTRSTGQASTSPTTAPSPLWETATPPSFKKGRTWTNKVDLSDLDSDGDVDILFAEGGNYDTPGKAVRSRFRRCALIPRSHHSTPRRRHSKGA
jgi:hypothetical protein